MTDEHTTARDASVFEADPDEAAAGRDSAADATAFSGSYKVLGELSDPNGAAGVVGRNTGGSGVTYGVVGETDSADNGAAGVQGNATGGNVGVEGRVYDNESNLPEFGSSDAAGVFGTSDRSDGIGVVGWSLNSIGVTARTDDFGTPALAAYNAAGGRAFETTGDAMIRGDQTVGADQTVQGTQSVSDVGVEVYQYTPQTVAGSHTRTQVDFDTVVVDDFDNWVPGDAQYEVPADGTYQVSAQVEYQTVPDGTTTELWVSVDGNDRIDVSAQGTDTLAASKALFALSAGDVIRVDTAQSDSTSHDTDVGRDLTFLTVARLG